MVVGCPGVVFLLIHWVVCEWLVADGMMNGWCGFSVYLIGCLGLGECFDGCEVDGLRLAVGPMFCCGRLVGCLCLVMLCWFVSGSATVLP